MKRKILSILILTAFVVIGASAQKGKTFADRITVKGYGQFGYSAKFEDEIGTSNSFNINKIEVLAIGKINHKWNMGITVQFHGRPMLKDLYAQYTVMPELRFRLGQFKTPFSIENNIAPFYNPLISGGTLPTIYFAGIAGHPHYYGTAGRDMGLEISGDLFDNVLSYKAVVFNGMGMNQLSNINPKLFGGSLMIRPIKEASIYTSYMGGYLQSMAGTDNMHRHRVSAGLQVTTSPVTLYTEYMWGQDGEQKAHGAYMTAAFHLPKRFDVVVSGDYINTDLSIKDRDIFTATLGLTQWFYGDCRWQIEYQYRNIRNDAGLLDIHNRGHKLAAQIQFVF